ncbi:MAG: hypothetical protein QM817_16040 [Archangium sp.]
MTLRVLVVLAVIAQSSWAQQDPIPFPRERLAKLLGLSLKDVPVKAPAVVISALGCQVLGTLQSRVVEASMASVQCTGKKAKSVHVGDELEDGVVEAIGFGVITVRRGERYEELGRGLAIASSAPVMIAARAAIPASEGRVSRAVVEELMKDPGPLLGQVQLMPAFAAGKFIGVRANFVREGSLVSTLGLQKNDVIRGVNGKSLDSLPAAFAALQTMNSTGDISLELERGGQTVVKTLRIE